VKNYGGGKVSKTMRKVGLLLFAGLLSGCDALDVPAVKDFRVSKWYESGPDTILDGAMRVSTSSHMDERYLTIRCFKGRAADAAPDYDLRYTIDVPLLERVAGELKKSTTLSGAVAVDGKASIEPAKLTGVHPHKSMKRRCQFYAVAL
jgi:hypothetical protein